MKLNIKKIKNELFKDHEIKEFCLNNEINDTDIINNLSKLVMQKDNNTICKGCSKSNCAMDPYGLHSKLVYENGKVEMVYFDCPSLDKNNDLKNIDMMFFSKADDFKKKKLNITANRAKALKQIQEFVDNYQKGKYIKGIYFYGQFGTGKTFLMHTLARELSEKNIKVIFAYYPDLVRYIKSSIGNNTLESTINKLKYVDVLMLDDIGAESNSSFIRDEVLGPILQFRLQACLPVCMTSNLSFENLNKHFMESRDEINQINSQRIIERMRYLMKELLIEDKDYRLNSI